MVKYRTECQEYYHLKLILVCGKIYKKKNEMK